MLNTVQAGQFSPISLVSENWIDWLTAELILLTVTDHTEKYISREAKEIRENNSEIW